MSERGRIKRGAGGKVGKEGRKRETDKIKLKSTEQTQYFQKDLNTMTSLGWNFLLFN